MLVVYRAAIVSLAMLASCKSGADPAEQGTCGDGVRDVGSEGCDGNDFGGLTCQDFGFLRGSLSCSSDCAHSITDACEGGDETSAVCGNGIVETGEECDTTVPAEMDCERLGFEGGTLACATDCTLDRSGCTGGSDTATPLDTDVDDGLVTLCVQIDSTSGYSCDTWVSTASGVAGASCDLDGADNGELWVQSAGWVDSPIGQANGAFSEVCGQVSADSGDVLVVNGDFDNTDGETPATHWWWCANWYGVGATAGSFTVDGVVVAPSVVGNGVGGFDCSVTVP